MKPSVALYSNRFFRTFGAAFSHFKHIDRRAHRSQRVMPLGRPVISNHNWQLSIRQRDFPRRVLQHWHSRRQPCCRAVLKCSAATIALPNINTGLDDAQAASCRILCASFSGASPRSATR